MLALYRKYRPKTLAEVVGQEALTTSLQNSIKSGKISHAYLFTGPRGCGKTSVARILAHEINHFPYELEDSYLDIIEIDAASNTGVDNIRELREKAVIAPSKGKYKVYIIDEVHMLSKSAFNALLKTLEEPPEHVVFIMATTDAHKVPVTISSRSQVYTFNLASPEVMENHLRKIADLEKINITDDALKIIASRGGGSFRDSLSLLDQISALGDSKTELTKDVVVCAFGLPQDALIEEILSAYKTPDPALRITSVSEILKKILNSGVKPETLAEEIIKKILQNPAPALLPLLEKLPTVSAPFPEAKLLLAFYNPVKMPEFEARSKMSQKIPNSSAKTATFTPVKPPVSAPKKPVEESAEIKPQTAEEPTVKTFDQAAFLEAVKMSNIVIFKQLEKSELLLEGNTLNIFPDKKIIKNILTRPNNFEVLRTNVPSRLEIIVHDPEDKDSFKKDPALSKISDIMGGGIKEVDNGGGIPF